MHGWFHFEAWETHVAYCRAAIGQPILTVQRGILAAEGHAGNHCAGAVHRGRDVVCFPSGQWRLDDGHHLGGLDRARFPVARLGGVAPIRPGPGHHGDRTITHFPNTNCRR